MDPYEHQETKKGADPSQFDFLVSLLSINNTNKFEFPVEIQIKVENIFSFFNKSL